MHLLFAHNDYARFSGEEAAVENLAGLLTAHGHRVSWLRPSSAGIGPGLGARISAFATGIYNPRSRRELARLLARDRADIVQAQNLYPFLSPSILAECRRQAVPVVMRCPNYRLFCPTGLHLRDGSVCERCLGPGREVHCVLRNCEGHVGKSLGYASRNAFARLSGMIRENVSRFLVLSDFQRRRFMAGGIPAEQLAVLPNIATVPPEPVRPIPQHGPVGFVGRLSPEKGIREILAAARLLPDVTFEVAGAVDDMAGAVASASANVRFHGFLAGAELRAFYENCRIMLCPSLWFEGFPNVIAAAMAAGRPVVASRIGAIPEIVVDGVTGLLCPPGDGEALAGAIRTLWDDPERCQAMGLAGRARAEKEYSPVRVYQRLLGVYTEVLQGR